MRETLFRGIIKNDNSRYKRGQWAIGDLVRLQDGNDGKPHIYGCGEVFAETVGQYTGLTDKNGTKIFEGDILSERPPMNLTAYIGYVAYDDDLAVWRFMIKNNDKYNCVLLGSYSNSYTVIGNIHDNLELLEVAK